MSRTIFFYVFLIFSLPTMAGEKTSYDLYLESLPPMPARERDLFDGAARQMYDEDCNCIAYTHEGVMRKFVFPLSDADRRLMIEGLKKNLISLVPPQNLI